MYPPPHSHPSAPVPGRWQRPALIVLMLVFVPPLGIVLAWRGLWSRRRKVVATLLSAMWFALPGLVDSPGKAPRADAGPRVETASAAPVPGPTPSSSPTPAPSEPVASYVGQGLKEAKAAARDAGYDAVSHDASPGNAGQWDDGNWRVCFQEPAAKPLRKRPTLDFGVVRVEEPCPTKDGDPIPHPKMPKVVGLAFARASEVLRPLGLRAVEARSAYTDVTLPGAVDEWTVCFQDPREDQEVTYPGNRTAHLSLTAPGTPCPGRENTELRPDPDPDPDPDPAPAPPKRGGSSSGGSSGGGGQAGVQFGRFCSPVGARATTGDGRPAKCFMGKDGRARWGYGS
ncbi:hypothetical protein ABZZ17_22445 [Streptomyces sp. NPDC006512]|uniref:PASTA domain-containing protein n=1 Tax=Streptomyces sp. NPDC006512 TaxID=3154307 RepID=UPI0033A5F72F